MDLLGTLKSKQTPEVTTRFRKCSRTFSFFSRQTSHLLMKDSKGMSLNKNWPNGMSDSNVLARSDVATLMPNNVA